MKQTLIVAAISAVALVGCSKEEQKIQGNTDESVTSFREMNVPEGFDFAGSKTVTFTSTGNSGLTVGAKGLLTVQTLDGITLLKHNRNLDQDFEMRINIPVGTKELVVVDGPIMKHVKINSPFVNLNSI
ncbi:hypothetical protein Oweho_1467 [Owenweeksia hongkongensis DSM 17368]|uniref:Uncharacterized protein n=1 Tax=Owenweeksia hongkongensis (strain DSM 17368 / CIP 108786 / JCM 12287 / NRRL B-23963 / UST20020801) TaxID=926562 RepID=G8R895_OWEHD|nr:hypothetical protein [Owenweeksia hongkongensis]AEV32463.1 hypothetical protein Oweho_1467 [Owenweeksia hongkongensis DSM 17368]